MSELEIYYAVSDHIYLVILCLITAYCLTSFVKPFMKKNKYVWTVGAVYFAVMTALYYIPYSFGRGLENFTAYGIGVLSAFIVMCLLDRRNIRQKIFLATTFYSLRWQTMYMEGCIDKLISYYFYYVLPKEPWSQKVQLLFFVLTLVIDLIISFGFMYGAVLMFRRAYLYKKEMLSGKELIMLIMPSLTGVVGYEMLQYYQMVYERDAGKSVYDLYGLHDVWRFIYCVLSLLTIFMMIIVFQSSKARQKEEKQQELLARQMEDMEYHIGEVEGLYQDIRSLRHDMGNHVMLLEQLYGQGEYKAAEKYLSDLKGQLQEAYAEIKSGNPITDVLLTEKKKEAESKGIAFCCSFHYPQSGEINAFDISVILSNALSNAIEAANSETTVREIHVFSYRRNRAYVIEVRNSFTGNLIVDEESGLPSTTKPAGTGHGFGLANIRRVARKYYGDLEIRTENGYCVLLVMLQV